MAGYLADLPGFQRPLDPLTERMQRTVDAAFEDVEGVVLVLSAPADRRRIRFIAQRVFALGVPVVICPSTRSTGSRAATSPSR